MKFNYLETKDMTLIFKHFDFFSDTLIERTLHRRVRITNRHDLALRYDAVQRGAVQSDAERCGAVRCGAVIGWMNVGREDERGVVLARRSITSKAFFSSFFYYTPLAPLKSLVSRRTIGWTNENPLDNLMLVA